jgi:hypothetical protein
LLNIKDLGKTETVLSHSGQDYDRRDVSKRKQDNPNRDEQQRDCGNNVNVRYIRRQTDQCSGRYNSGYHINQDGRNFNRRVQGRVGENETSKLNPTAPRFNPQDERTPARRNTGRDNTQDLNN